MIFWDATNSSPLTYSPRNMSSYRVVPVDRSDVSTLITLSHAAFSIDRHTLMKMHEKGTSDMSSEMGGPDTLYGYLDNERVRMMKAVSDDEEIVGFTTWVCKNFDGDQPSVTEAVAYGSAMLNPGVSLSLRLPYRSTLPFPSKPTPLSPRSISSEPSPRTISSKWLTGLTSLLFRPSSVWESPSCLPTNPKASAPPCWVGSRSLRTSTRPAAGFISPIALAVRKP